MTHISSTPDRDEGALIAQKIVAVIRAYGTDDRYTANDIHLIVETIPNVRKIMVMLNSPDPVQGVLAFQYRFVNGMGVQGETVIHRPDDHRWVGLVESLYPSARRIVQARYQRHA